MYKRVDFIEVRGNDFSQTSHGLIASMSGNGRSFGTHHGSYKASTQVLTSDGAFPELDYWQYNNIREANYFIEKIKPKVTLKKRDKNEISRVTKDAFKTLGRISIIKSISNIYLIKSILDDLASLFF